jgi:esterase
MDRVSAKNEQMKLHFEVYGAGQPLFILHGLFGSLENWHSISTKLSETFRVYAVDLRNHGRSPHSPEMNYSVMAGDLKELIQGEALDRVSLMGHSLGGKVAMQFSLSFPDRVEKLIVVDMAPRAYPPHHDEIFKAMLGLDLNLFQSRQEIEAALAPAIPDLAVRRFLLKSLKRDPNGGFHWQLNLPALHDQYAQLNRALATDRSCDRPALFLRAEKSDYIRDTDEPLICRLFPRAQIRIVQGADHWMHADVPETFLRNVQEFLRD